MKEIYKKFGKPLSVFLALACNDLDNKHEYSIDGDNGFHNGELIATNIRLSNDLESIDMIWIKPCHSITVEVKVKNNR